MDDRGHPLALVVDGRPGATGAHFGKRHRVPALIDIGLAIWKPIGDPQRPVAQAGGERLAHGGPGRQAGDQQRTSQSAQHDGRPADEGDGHHRERNGKEDQQNTEHRAGAERPDVARASPGDGTHAEHEQDHGRGQPGADQGDRRHRRRQAQAQQRHRPPEGATAQPVADPLEQPCIAPGWQWRERRDLRTEQPVGEVALEAGAAPEQPDSGDQQRQPDPERAEQHTDQNAADHQQQVHGAEWNAERQVCELATDALRVQPALLRRSADVERHRCIGGRLCLPAHRPPSTVTLPPVLSALIVNGAAGSLTRPVTCGGPSPDLAASR